MTTMPRERLSDPLSIYRVYRTGKRAHGAVVGLVVVADGWEHARELASEWATGQADSSVWTHRTLTDTEYLGQTPRGDVPRVVMVEYAR